jgi:hypothetical protein
MRLTHGARAVLCHAKQSGQPDALRRWAVMLEKKRGHNVATIALANRLARIAWAVTEHPYPATSEHFKAGHSGGE